MIETPYEVMLELNWNQDILIKSKKFLKDWDIRTDSFYKENKVSKLSIRFDKSEREHLRNSINFWEKRLNNENNNS